MFSFSQNKNLIWLLKPRSISWAEIMTHFLRTNIVPVLKTCELLSSLVLHCMERIRTWTSGPKSSRTTGSCGNLTELHAVTHPDTELLRRNTSNWDYIWGNTLHGQQPALMGCTWFTGPAYKEIEDLCASQFPLDFIQILLKISAL